MIARTGFAVAVLAVLAAARAWAAFLAAAAVVAMIWLARLWLYPRGPCLACKGRRGRNPGSGDEQWGDCLVCHRTGERLRFGAEWVRPNLRKK